ncbi:hypothetical protein SAMN05444272_1625 [Roseibium suaedae]|uniref:Uncharacterized protein n=1 Tax=Roseibium suaedae TaxID=735517 RepID=A0A1M7FIZ5_9HYPH|nr:hypothetical protein SAMN05444272_1625 [Roseibium suaedae]
MKKYSKTLKDLTVTCIASDDEITASLFVESTLRAATGKVWIDKDIIKLFSNTYAIQGVNFGMDLTISLKN